MTDRMEPCGRVEPEEQAEPSAPRETPRDPAAEASRARRIAELKAAIRAGTYRADIGEIARHLAMAMSPTD